MNVLRANENPIIKPFDIKPTRPDFEVIGAFNAAVTKYDGDVILLLRIAEKPIQNDPENYIVPVFEIDENKVIVKSISKSDPENDFSDERQIVTKEATYLTSIAHLRLARSHDGINFDIEERPFIFPDNQYETFGTEDPRITLIGDTYYINYGAISKDGLNIALASTKDFKSVERLGIIFCPDNKDVTIFPEKINGKYYALHRPSNSWFAGPEMWIAESPDLMCWGNHRKLIGRRPGKWDASRIGASAVPFKVEGGWLEIYHGVINNVYAIGALLLDENEPWKVIARSDTPIMEPEAEYETNGFWGKVVFPCGALCENGVVKLYYGAADAYTCYAEIKLNDIMESLNILNKREC